jgi:hypothetical protein
MPGSGADFARLFAGKASGPYTAACLFSEDSAVFSYAGSHACGLESWHEETMQEKQQRSRRNQAQGRFPSLLLLSIAFNSFTRLLFTDRNSLCRHGAAVFTVEEFPPLDGRFSLL